MTPLIKSIDQLLSQAKERQFISVMETESLKIACQKFDGEHRFRHLNEDHDEVIYVMSGELTVWTDQGEHHLKKGEMLKIPKGVEHGDLFGKKVEILIIDAKL